MKDAIILSHGGMCSLDWVKDNHIVFDSKTGKWILDVDFFHEEAREKANLGVNSEPMSTYCVGRKLLKGFKELCQPWIVTVANKYDLFNHNDNYFDAFFGLVAIKNTYNITPIANIINGCDFNFDSRYIWSPLNGLNNIQGIDKFYDIEAIPVIKKLVERLLYEQKKRGAKIIWEFGKELDNPTKVEQIKRLVDQAFMPVFKEYGIRGWQLSMGARTLNDSTGSAYPAPVVQTKIRQLVTKWLDKPDDDLALRPTHGLRKDAVGNEPTPALKFAMSELSDFSALLSDDGANRKGATPDWWKAQLEYVFQHPKMQNPFVHEAAAAALGVKRCKVSFEKFSTDENDIPNVKAIVATCEKYGFTFANKGKFPKIIKPEPPKPPVDPPDDPPVTPDKPPVDDPVVTPAKPSFNLDGLLRNWSAWIRHYSGWIILFFALVAIAILIW